MKKIISLIISLLLTLSCFSILTAAQITQQPRIVETVYPTEDVVVADIVLTEPPYNADNTGKEDVTAILNRAIKDCFNNGGGTVFLPVGNYRLTGNIDILPFVTVRGDWANPTIYGNAYGTVILADVPSSDAFTPGLFTVGGSAGAMGLTVYYPNQSITAPVPYPYTFYVNGNGASYMLQSIVNVTLLNSYRGIGACAVTRNGIYECHEMLTVDNFYATVLCEGISTYNSADVDTYKNIFISPSYWVQAGKDYNAPTWAQLSSFTRENTTALRIGDLEWPQFANIHISDCKYGLLFDHGIRISFSGTFYDLYVDRCTYGLYAPEGTINAREKSWGIAIGRGSIYGSEYAIYNPGKAALVLTDTDVQGKVKAVNMINDTLTDLSDFAPDYNKTYTKPIENLSVVQADRTGHTDTSSTIQQVLDSLADGGVCYLPAGMYRLDAPLTVPAGVELRGSGSVATRDQQSSVKGTQLLAYYGYEENDTALITLNGNNAGVNAIRTVFVKNNPNPDGENGIYNPTKPAILVKADSCYIVNSNVNLASVAVQLENCDGFFSDKLIGCCYSAMFKAENCTNVWLEGSLFNGNNIPRNGYAATDIPELQNWMTEDKVFTHLFDPILRKECTYIRLHNTQATVLNCFIYGGRCFAETENSHFLAINFGCDGQSKTMSMLQITGGEMTAINSMRSTFDGRDGAGKSYTADKSAVIRLYNRLSVDLSYKEPNITRNVQYEGADKLIFAIKNLFAELLMFFGDKITTLNQK